MGGQSTRVTPIEQLQCRPVSVEPSPGIIEIRSSNERLQSDLSWLATTPQTLQLS